MSIFQPRLAFSRWIPGICLVFVDDLNKEVASATLEMDSGVCSRHMGTNSLDECTQAEKLREKN